MRCFQKSRKKIRAQKLFRLSLTYLKNGLIEVWHKKLFRLSLNYLKNGLIEVGEMINHSTKIYFGLTSCLDSKMTLRGHYAQTDVSEINNRKIAKED
jgi:hypothetical protein